MTLREKIAAEVGHMSWSVNLETADAILAVIRTHMTSPEAVERAQGHLRCEVSYATIGKCAVTPGDVMTKKAILAALGGGPEPFKCPINHAGCTEHCSNYGCGVGLPKRYMQS